MSVYLLAIGAALLFGVGSVVQQHSAAQAPPGKVLRFALLWYLVRQPLWLAGVGTSIVGNLLSGTALAQGSVALVQPLLVTRLLFALPLAAAWMHRAVPRRDWFGAIATAVGLGAFIAAGNPEPSQSGSASLWRWVFAGAAVGALVLVLVLVGRGRSPARQAPMLGAGAGLLFGLQAGLTQTAVRDFTAGGLSSLLLDWPVYAVIITAVLGTLLSQSAFEMAPLTASYPALASVEPIAGIGVGIGVLGGTLRLDSLPLAFEIVGLLIMTVGIFLLATSPLVTGQLDLLERRQEEGEEYRLEEHVEQDFAAAERELAELATSARGRNRRERLLADIERGERGLARLDELRAHIASHQRHERDREQGASDQECVDILGNQQMLDARQRDIEERAARLRQRAGELHRLTAEAGVDLAPGVGGDAGGGGSGDPGVGRRD